VLDLKAIREDPEPFRRALERRGAAADLDRALELDERRRALIAEVEGLRAEQNRVSKQLGHAVARIEGEEFRQRLLEQAHSISAQIKELEPKLAQAESEFESLAARLPNIPDESAPDGRSDEDNEVLRVEGEPPTFDFEPKDHLELGQALGMIDAERGARTSGARFAYLTSDAVLIQFALVQYGLVFALERGLIPVVPPVLVREEAMYGTGFLPTDEAQIYVTREDDLYLVGTSEVPLAALHTGEILEPEDLPRRYVGYSTCFRREAGTYGKDTRGIFRVHQFDKMEMFSFVLPEESRDEHDRLLAWQEEWVRSLELPYRVVNVCTGELGASAAKKYDLEVWLPGQGKYRELTSTSNTTDYQARRLECRVRLPDGNRPVHTLNGTLCAIGRTIVALLENGQREDGTVELPAVLRAYIPHVRELPTEEG
jgi:seryl-tRNA synthetase